jgi:hypothetical protein
VVFPTLVVRELLLTITKSLTVSSGSAQMPIRTSADSNQTHTAPYGTQQNKVLIQQLNSYRYMAPFLAAQNYRVEGGEGVSGGRGEREGGEGEVEGRTGRTKGWSTRGGGRREGEGTGGLSRKQRK